MPRGTASPTFRLPIVSPGRPGLASVATSTDDPEVVYRTLVQTLVSTVGADEVYVYQIDADGQSVITYGVGGPRLQSLVLAREGRPAGVGWVALSGQPMIAPNPAALASMAPELARSLTCAILVPVVVQRRVHAVVIVARRSERGFDALEADRVVELVEHASTAVALVSARAEASRDPLTGCLNRRGMLERLDVEIGRAERKGSPLCALLMDLDDFKRVNDVFGHQAGDEVLREVGKRLEAQVRAIDYVARYGGDEFVVVLPDAPLEAAGSVARRALDALQGLPRGVGHHASSSSIASGGLAGWMHPMTAEELLATADAALLRAKQTDKGRLEIVVDSRPASPGASGEAGPPEDRHSARRRPDAV